MPSVVRKFEFLNAFLTFFKLNCAPRWFVLRTAGSHNPSSGTPLLLPLGANRVTGLHHTRVADVCCDRIMHNDQHPAGRAVRPGDEHGAAVVSAGHARAKMSSVAMPCNVIARVPSHHGVGMATGECDSSLTCTLVGGSIHGHLLAQKARSGLYQLQSPVPSTR